LVVDDEPNSPGEPEIEDSRVVNRNVFYEGTDEDEGNKEEEEVVEEEDVF
jgi:hypothetical protein